MTSLHLRFWTACILASAGSFLVTAFLTSMAAYLVFFIFAGSLLWLLAGYARAAGGLAQLAGSRAFIVSAGATIALLVCCGCGAFLGIAKLTGLQD